METSQDTIIYTLYKKECLFMASTITLKVSINKQLYIYTLSAFTEKKKQTIVNYWNVMLFIHQ